MSDCNRFAARGVLPPALEQPSSSRLERRHRSSIGASFVGSNAGREARLAHGTKRKSRTLIDDKLAREYEEPYGWWGLERATPHPLTLPRLISTGMLGAGEAALLTLAIEMRRSIIVAAEEDGAGKTTLLTALLAFMDPQTRPIYIRGIYERFAYIDALDPENRYVLCNEISAHLPTYLWGRGVRYLFEGLARGFPLATTMHAGSASDVLATLQRYPLEVLPADVAGLDLVVMLRRGMVDGHEVRRVVSVDRVVEQRGAPALRALVERDPLRAAPQLFSGRMIAALVDWGDLSDAEASQLLARQERFLRECVATHANDPEGYQRALAEFRG